MLHAAHLCRAVTLVLLTFAPAYADLVTVTFDAPPCAPLGPSRPFTTGNAYPGHCYAGVGLLLSSRFGNPAQQQAVFDIVQTPYSDSAPNAAMGHTGIDVRGDFVLPDGSTGLTDFVSWRVIDPFGETGGVEPWGLLLFGVGGLSDVLYESPLFPFLQGSRWVTFSRPQRDIAGFVWVGGNEQQWIDNVAFNRPAPNAAAPVPEPSTLLLIGIGAAAMIRRGRR